MIGIYRTKDEVETRRVLTAFRSKNAEFHYKEGWYHVILPISVPDDETVNTFHDMASAVAHSDLQPLPLITFNQVTNLIGYKIEVLGSKCYLGAYVNDGLGVDRHIRYLIEKEHVPVENIKITAEVS